MTFSKKVQWYAIAIAIILALVMLGSVDAYAASSNLYLNYNDIQDLVEKENLQLEILRENFDALVDARADMRDAKKTMSNLESTFAGLSDALGAATQAANDAANGMNPVDDAAYLASVAAMSQTTRALQGTLMMNQAALTTINMDSINMQVDQMKITIEQTEDTLVNTAQGLFVLHHQMQTQLKQMDLSRSLLEESIRLANVALNTGTGTKLEVLQAEFALTEFDNAVSQLKNSSQQLTNNLKMLVGWGQNETMVLGTMPAPDRTFVAKINIDTDIQTALTNSYSLKILQKEYNYTEKKQQYIVKLNMDLTREQIALNLKNQYVLLQQQSELLTLEEERLEVMAQQLEQSRKQVELGMLSDIMLQSEETSYQSQLNVVETAKSTLFNEIENYKAMVAGLN